MVIVMFATMDYVATYGVFLEFGDVERYGDSYAVLKDGLAGFTLAED